MTVRELIRDLLSRDDIELDTEVVRMNYDGPGDEWGHRVKVTTVYAEKDPYTGMRVVIR